jgi:hypothetical protein
MKDTARAPVLPTVSNYLIWKYVKRLDSAPSCPIRGGNEIMIFPIKSSPGYELAG